MDDGSAALDVLCRGQLPLRAAAAATVIAGVDACYLPPGRYDTKRLNHFELQFRVGDVVRVVPNHVCVVVNMMDEVVMVRGDEIIGALPVTARGKLR